MLPDLAAGDRLLVRRTQRPRRGDVVALRDPRDTGRVLVKRVAELNDLRHGSASGPRKPASWPG